MGFSLPDMLYLSGCWTGPLHTVGQSCLRLDEEGGKERTGKGEKLSVVYSEHVVRGAFIGLEVSSTLKMRWGVTYDWLGGAAKATAMKVSAVGSMA